MSTKESANINFGLMIAYLLPGFTVTQGWPFASSALAAPGILACASDGSIAGFLDATIQALTAGLTVSTVRWLILDRIHHHAGIRPPSWDFALLDKSVGAFEFLIQAHYRDYKFYANMVVALTWTYATQGYRMGWHGLVYLILACLFYLGSRDALSKYYSRAGQLLASRNRQETD